MITTLTTNPMLDKTLYLPGFETGKIFRSSRVEDVAGGKGINISLQLNTLGIDNIALGFLAGPVGEQIKHILDNDKIKNDFVWAKGNTRIGFTVLNETNLEQTSVFEPNHRVSSEEKKSLVDKCSFWAKDSKFLAVAGSVPDKSIVDIYREIISRAKEANPGIKVFFDAYGTEFNEGIKSLPFFVKQNKKECESFLNKRIENQSDYVAALNEYRGIDMVVITNGSEYSYIRYKDAYYRVAPPKIDVVNPIGCGDTMTAGFIYGFYKKYDIVDIIKFAFAASAANAAKWLIAKNKYEEIEQYLNKVAIDSL